MPSYSRRYFVSMPHAALCVSRQISLPRFNNRTLSFNAARSIVCVETSKRFTISNFSKGFNAARSIVCVETPRSPIRVWLTISFQCRTQHCVCRDRQERMVLHEIYWFQCRTQHCVCRDRCLKPKSIRLGICFNAARSIVCVETPNNSQSTYTEIVFQCRTQHCVCRDAVR